MKKNLILTASLVFSLGTTVSSVQASTIDDMENKKHEIQHKRQEVNSGIHHAESTIKNLKGKQQTVAEKIQSLTTLINKTTTEIDNKTAEIEQTKLEIAKLKKDIQVIKERMAQREELLKERARAMQVSGGNADYLEVILGSKSFGDFIERVNAVSTIMDADQEILRQQEEDKKKLEHDQKQVETKLANLQQMLQDLQTIKNQQKKQVVELSRLMDQLKTKEKEEHEGQMNLQEQDELLSAQEASIQQAINLEKTRQAELEAARKRAAEEAKQRAAENAKQAAEEKEKSNLRAKRSNISTNHSHQQRSVQSYKAPAPSPAPAISNGIFTRPAAGILSSNYGARWGEKHMGVDIASSGYVPIVAAADGVVSRAYASSSYGNVVFISHSINGQVYTTVYGHMRSYSVSSGQVVAKGQQIGVMGSTGHSTGQHLHFELHKGPWNIDKTNAVNPVGIVPF